MTQDIVLATLAEDFITPIVIEESTMAALISAQQARELLSSRRAEAQASVTPFLEQANDAVSAAIRKDEDAVTLSLETIQEAARPLAIKELKKLGYVCLASDSLTTVRIGW